MKNYLFFLTAFTFSFLIAQQAPEIEWSKTYGGSNSESCQYIVNTIDGGFLLTGQSLSSDGDVIDNKGYSDVWIVKINMMGIIEWQKVFGGSRYEIPVDLKATLDGGYIFVGHTNSLDGDVQGWHEGYSENFPTLDYWVVKLDKFGNIQWQKCLGGTGDDYGYSIDLTSTGGYIISGFSGSFDGDISHYFGGGDFWIVKLDSNGNLLWEKSFGGTGNDQANSIIRFEDNKYMIVGQSNSNDGEVSGNHGNSDMWVICIDDNGQLIWEESYGGSGYDSGNKIQSTIDGGFVIAAISNSNNGDVTSNNGGVDYWIVKIDNIGNIEWQKSFGGSNLDAAQDIFITVEKNYIVSGNSLSIDGDVLENKGESDFWILKLDELGELIWQKSLGGSKDEFSNVILPIQDNGFITVGNTLSSNDGDVPENNGSSDFWIVKLGPEQMSTSENEISKITIHPNPVKDILNFSEKLNQIEIYNLSGMKLMNKSEGQNINLDKLPTGTYILNAKDQKGQTITQKFIKK